MMVDPESSNCRHCGLTIIHAGQDIWADSNGYVYCPFTHDRHSPEDDDNPFVSLIPIPGEWHEELSRIQTLNRMDEQYGCDFVVMPDPVNGQHDYCGDPEWHPFTNRCAEHIPGEGYWIDRQDHDMRVGR